MPKIAEAIVSKTDNQSLQGQKPDSQRLVREGLLGPEYRVLCGALWGSVELRGSHTPACSLRVRQEMLEKVRMNGTGWLVTELC